MSLWWLLFCIVEAGISRWSEQMSAVSVFLAQEEKTWSGVLVK